MINTRNTYRKNLNCVKLIKNCAKNAELLDKTSQLQFFYYYYFLFNWQKGLS